MVVNLDIYSVESPIATDIYISVTPKQNAPLQNQAREIFADIRDVICSKKAFIFQERIFAPLKLEHTYVYNSTLDQSDQNPAAIYYKDRVLNAPMFLSSSGPDGGIVSTISESLVFLRAFFDGKLFDETFLERMMNRWNMVFFPIRYGYGLMRFKLPRIFSPFKAPPEYIGHSGSTGSFAFYCPKNGLYPVGTVNQIATPGKPFRLMVQATNMVR